MEKGSRIVDMRFRGGERRREVDWDDGDDDEREKGVSKWRYGGRRLFLRRK